MRIKTETWISWIGGIAVVLVSAVFFVVTFAYAQFETKEHAREVREATQDQLNRIERKLDALGGFKFGSTPER